MEELIINNSGEIHLNLGGANLDESLASALLGEHLLPFIDNENNTQFLVKVIDSNGSLYLDPSQFANFTLEQQPGVGDSASSSPGTGNENIVSCDSL